MADDKKENENSPGGNDWEFVSLTASVYASAPGPNLPPSEKKDAGYSAKRFEPSDMMFMSGHFQLQPNEYENFLKEADCKAGQSEFCTKDFSHADIKVDDPNKSCGESCKSKSYDDTPSIQLLEQQKGIAMDEIGFGHGKSLEGLDLVLEEPAMNMGSAITKPVSYSTSGSCISPTDVSPPEKGNGKEDLGVPCEVWWKRQVSFMYNNAKEATTFWSIFVAASVVGLAILGQHCHAKLQFEQFRLQFNINCERISCTVGPLSRFKGTLLAGDQSSPSVQGNSASAS